MTSLTRVTAAVLIVGALALAACVLMLRESFSLVFAAAVAGTYSAAALIVVARIAAFHPHARFGAANVVTLARLVLTCLFAGLAAELAFGSESLSVSLAWMFVVVAIFSLALDGLDGYLARRTNLVSPFGSRFDMETDALQILLLSILAHLLGKAGAWVLLAGLLRYIYVAAGWVWPALAMPLPASLRRKIICVIQSGALAALLAPVLVPPVSTALAAVALLLLIVSFAQDTIWGLSHHRSEHGPQ
jgi:phosphatidylglycerophosphate synthase